MENRRIPYASLINFTGVVFVIGLTLFLFIYGRNIVMPIIIALLITFLISAMSEPLERLKIFNRSMPTWLAQTVSIIVIGLGITAVGRMGRRTVRQMVKNQGTILENLEKLFGSAPMWLLDLLPPLTLNTVRNSVPTRVDLFSGSLDMLTNVLRELLVPVASFAGQSLIVLVYVIFMLIEQRHFSEKLKELYDDEESNETLQRVLKSIADNVRTYFGVKTVVSLLVGVESLIVMWLFGLDNAIFWAILIFLLNYIPYLGSLVAVIFPAVFSLAQFGDWTTFLSLTVILYAIQIFSGTFVEPLMAGRSLNLSPLVVFASITIFGSIWGAIGMILSVPLVLIMTITFSHFEATRPIALLFSGRGRLTFIEPEIVVKRRRPAPSFRIEK
ncbi:MAG: AI-2E family transporter [Anaerolineae bacterium]